MKFPIWIVAGAVCAGAPSVAHAQDQGGPLLSPVELELQKARADDQLIKLAQAAKINVMADATDWPDDGKVAGRVGDGTLTVSKKQTLIEWLQDIGYANRLTWERNGNTVVLWPEPDIVPLTRRVVDEAVTQLPQIEAEIKPALQGALDPEVVARLNAEPGAWLKAIQRHGLYDIVLSNSLLALLQEKHGWDGRNQGFQLQLKDAQIPADLRTQIILSRRLAQARPQTDRYAWLRDETWQNVRLVVQQSQPTIINGKVQPRQWRLSVAAPVGGQESIRSVATLSTEDGGEQ